LESLRGIAALMVAGWHSFSVFSPLDWQAAAGQFAKIPLNGHAAVTLFFVLSGLVLGRSLVRGRGPFLLNYATFALRRFFRICPAFFAACFLIAGAILWLDPPLRYSTTVSDWFAGHWSQPITGKFFLSNLLLQNHEMNPPSWTLRAELVCSMALPLLFLSLRVGWWMRGLVLAGLMAWEVLGKGNLSQWLFMFYLGFLLPEAASYIRNTFLRHQISGKWLALVLWVALCAEFTLFGEQPQWGNLLEGFTAAGFVSALLYGPELKVYRLFDWAPTRFYGRISYSFYLYHMVCLYFVSKMGFRLIGMDIMASDALVAELGLLICSTAVATFVAWLSYEYIEQPAIGFSKGLCRFLETCFNNPAKPQSNLRLLRSNSPKLGLRED
jgi:peptidoglycan/LPS O-acetylase OafA/YrhL